jgi:hypothetical protein
VLVQERLENVRTHFMTGHPTLTAAKNDKSLVKVRSQSDKEFLYTSLCFSDLKLTSVVHRLLRNQSLRLYVCNYTASFP